MYYSKNYPKSRAQSITVPRNYSGNTFRVIDETDRTYTRAADEDRNANFGTERHLTLENAAVDRDEHRKCGQNDGSCSHSPTLASLLPDPLSEKDTPISSLLKSISVEDVLLLGIMLVIYTNDPSDPTLLLLLVLLLAK